MPVSDINLQHLLREVDSMKRKLDAFIPVDDALWWPHFRLEWNYQTALMCGYPLHRTEAVLLQHEEAVAGHEEAATLIRNHDAALHAVRLLAAERRAILGLEDIKAVHAKILGWDGNWRTEEITLFLPEESVFHSASPGDIPARMEELLGWCQRYAFDTHPVLVATEWHLGISRIQPFDQGNGRMARLLLNFHLMRHGYPPVIFPAASRQQYQEALMAALQEDEAALAGYIAKQLILSMDWLLDRLRERSGNYTTDWETALSVIERQLSPADSNTGRTPDLLRQRLHDSLLPLVELTLQKTNRIDRLYAETQRALHVYSEGHLEKTTPEQSRSFFENRHADALEKILEMDLILRWSNARYHNALGYDLSLNLQFRFGPLQYEIIGPDYQRILAKNYDLPLLQAEQDLVLEEIGKFLIEKLKT